MSLEALRTYANFLERLDESTLVRFDELAAREVRFKDPFNDVVGTAAMKRIFKTMLEDLGGLEIKATHVAMVDPAASDSGGGTEQDAAAGAALGFIHWRMTGKLVRMANRDFDVTGVSTVTFDDAGRVVSHIDYWDVASGLYEMFPVLGPTLRWVRRRLAAA